MRGKGVQEGGETNPKNFGARGSREANWRNVSEKGKIEQPQRQNEALRRGEKSLKWKKMESQVSLGENLVREGGGGL